MLTLHYAPRSRAMRVISLIEELGVRDRVTLHRVDISRQDGSGAPDPANPHPERKVPVLQDGDTVVTESGAVMLYLTTRFPEGGMAPLPDDPAFGTYLTWMVWYGSVQEPVLVCDVAGLSHPIIAATFRGMPEVAARLRAALDRGPWLLGDRYSAADVLCHSPYAWFPDATPDDPLIRDWVARCMARPAARRVAEWETAQA